MSGSSRFILDSLVQEVLQQQPTAIQDFLLKTSILETFCPSLCEALCADTSAVGTPDPGAIPESLERSDLFIVRLHEQGQWYRYHRLFADLLRKRLSQTCPDGVEALHARASAWHGTGATVACEMGSPENAMERDCFPQTTVFVEGSDGTAEIGCGYQLSITTRAGTRTARHAPARHRWSDPSHEVVDASIVECNRRLLAAMRGEAPAETSGEDNLTTLALVYASYDSAERGAVVRISDS